MLTAFVKKKIKIMEIIKNNITKIPVSPMPPLWSFGGYNVSIETDKIESINYSYFEDFETGELNPVLVFTLTSGTKVMVNYEAEENAKFAMNYYKKEYLWKKKV